MKTTLPLLLLGTVVLTVPAVFAARGGDGSDAGGAGNGYGGAGRTGGFSRGGKQPDPSASDDQPATPPTSNQPANNSASSTSDQSSNSDSSNSSSSSDSNPWAIGERILNSDNLSADFQNGLFQWKNIKFDLGNNLLVRARFERYLSQPGTADTDEQYQHILNQIKELLSPSTVSDADLHKAFDLLGEAAKFEQDGGGSATLVAQISDAWRVRDEIEQKQGDANELAILRKQQQDQVAADTAAMARQANINSVDGVAGPLTQSPTLSGADRYTYSAPNAAGANAAAAAAAAPYNPGSASGGQSSQSSQSQGSSSTPPVVVGGSGATDSYGNPVVGSSVSSVVPGLSLSGDPSSILPTPQNLPNFDHATSTYFDAQELARTMAEEIASEGKAVSMGVLVKLQYQTQVIAFMLERRFQHSLMAGQFYSQIFKGSEQRMDVGKDAMSKFMSVDNFVPSVNSFTFISSEAIADTDTGMKAVETLYDSGERWGALEQLQQTFLLGEMLPSVQTFDPAKRKVLLNIYRESNDLKNVMDLRDLDGAADIVKKIQADASDFPIAPIISAINEGKQTSELALYKAKSALLSGDTDAANAAFAEATKYWPLNPDIKNLGAELDNKMNDKVALAPKFDDLVKEGNDREIYNQRIPFGMAFYDDPDRLDKYKEIVDRVGKVDMMVGLADNALKQNNGYLAWEMLVSAAQLEPSDPVVALAQRNASSSVAPFVSALDAADRAEKAGEFASSLNYYLQAQDIYPASKLAHDGIELAGQELMAKLNPNGPSARALAEAEAAKAMAPPPAPAQSMPAPAPARSSATPPVSSSSPAPGDTSAPGASSTTGTTGRTLF